MQRERTNRISEVTKNEINEEIKSEGKWTNQRRNRSDGGQIVVVSCFH